MRHLLPLLGLLAACGRNTAPESDLDVVPFVDPERYMGLWYEIAAFPSAPKRTASAPRRRTR